MTTRLLRAAAAAVTTAGLLVLAEAGPAAAATDCPHGQQVCVYLPGGTYTLGNPVTTGTGYGPTSVTLAHRCNSTGTECETTYLNLPGLVLTSASTAILTLHVPGEGVGLSGTTPTLYLGVPSVTPGTPSTGLTLRVTGTTFVVYDTALDTLACESFPVPSNPVVGGEWSACGADLTVTL